MIDLVVRYTLPAALSLLPEAMDTIKARALLVAIALQESGFRHRKQLGGPALGLWHFEEAAVREVLRHPDTEKHAKAAVETLLYGYAVVYSTHAAIQHNDVLACCFARLLLWRLPEKLPGRDEADEAWTQYLAAWRPGKPRYDDWDENYRLAWAATTEGP